jgi:hypothetical protein
MERGRGGEAVSQLVNLAEIRCNGRPKGFAPLDQEQLKATRELERNERESRGWA